jgi:preprotein translocase subunit SecA
MPALLSEDKIWFDARRKFQQISNELKAAGSSGCGVLVLAHFEATLAVLTESLRVNGVSYQRFSLFDATRLCAGSSPVVWVGLAREFQAPSVLPAPTSPSRGIQIIVAEHHPKQSRDQAVIDAALSLPCPSGMCFHFSLDDPLLLHFNGDSIQKLFSKMGIDEEECLSHHLITSAIRNAQRKIESETQRDLQTESIEDWFRYNLENRKS